MALISTEIASDNSGELTYHSIQALQIESTTTSHNEYGMTAFGGSLGCEPQVSASTLWFSNSSEMGGTTYNFTETSLAGMMTLSSLQSMRRSRWFSMRSSAVFSVMDMSPPLAESELLDLVESEKELEHGRGKRFKDPKALLEDLDS